jgi:uncharacterized protein YjbI with pentapeptide repeats
MREHFPFPRSFFLGPGTHIADFRNTSLNDSIFMQARLTRAGLSGAKLRNVDLRGADISEATLRVNDVYGAIVSPAQAMELSRLLGVQIR